MPGNEGRIVMRASLYPTGSVESKKKRKENTKVRRENLNEERFSDITKRVLPPSSRSILTISPETSDWKKERTNKKTEKAKKAKKPNGTITITSTGIWPPSCSM